MGFDEGFNSGVGFCKVLVGVPDLLALGLPSSSSRKQFGCAALAFGVGRGWLKHFVHCHYVHHCSAFLLISAAAAAAGAAPTYP